MPLPILLLFLITIIFALLIIYLSFKEEKLKKDLQKQKEEMDRKVYELSIFNEISEKIGYSLNIETIAQTIALTVENLFSLSTVSYGLIEKDKIVIKNLIKEPVGPNFIKQVSNIIFASLSAIDKEVEKYPVQITNQATNSSVNLPFDTLNNTYQTLNPEQNKSSDFQGENAYSPGFSEKVETSHLEKRPQSYFNIPLVVNNSLVGMINIASQKKAAYQEEDMSILYKIVNSAQKSLGKLNAVIETEKGKLESLVYSLSSGTVLFLFRENKFELSLINPAAKAFLQMRESSDMAALLAKFPKNCNIQDRIKDALTRRNTVAMRDIVINEKNFDIFLNPVFFYSTGRIIGVSMIIRDTTLEKKIEEMRRDFTNIMVHELRSPLVAIKGAADLLSESNLKREERDKMLQVIVASTQKMMSSIKDFLDASKIEAGRLEINKTFSSMKKVVSEHINLFSFAAREKNIEISLDSNPDIPNFFFDTERIGQVIDNLLSNSIKYTQNNGKIAVKLSVQDEFLEVEVRDNGIGIPDDKKAFLFSKFGQIDHHKSSNSSGLGLYIVKQIIEAHKGKIWIESKEKEGTSVFFSLPILKVQDDKPSLVKAKIVN